MADPTTQQPLDIASLLGQAQPKVSLGDIVALLTEMRARKQAEAAVTTSPLAQIMSSLVQPAQMAGSNSLQGYLGNKLAMMNNEDARMGQLDKLKSGSLIPLDQLQQHNGPPAGNFMEDLKGLGINPEDFRTLLGLKSQPQAVLVAPPQAPVQPQADPNDPMTQAIIAQNNRTGTAEPAGSNNTAAIMAALQAAGHSQAEQLPPTRYAGPPIQSGVSDIVQQILQRKNMKPQGY